MLMSKRPLNNGGAFVKIKLKQDGTTSGDYQVVKKFKPEVFAAPLPGKQMDMSSMSVHSFMDDLTFSGLDEDPSTVTHFNIDSFNKLIDMATLAAASSSTLTIAETEGEEAEDDEDEDAEEEEDDEVDVKEELCGKRAWSKVFENSTKYWQTMKVKWDEDFQFSLNHCSQLLRLRNVTKGFREMNVPADRQISSSLRPHDSYIKLATNSCASFLDAMNVIGGDVVGKRYFLSHAISPFRSAAEKQFEMKFLFECIIKFLGNLVANAKNGMISIQNASVLFVTDCRAKYADLHSLFVNHSAWVADQKKSISSYFICTKSNAMQYRDLSEEEQKSIKDSDRQLSKLDAKFQDLTNRYVLVITTYQDTVSLFNNLGKFRKHRFSNMTIVCTKNL